MRKSIVASAFFGLVVVLASSASATVINVDFNKSGSATGTYSGQGAYSDLPINTFWNGINGPGPLTSGALIASDGVTNTGVTVSVGTSLVYDTADDGPAFVETTLAQGLLNDLVYSTASSATFSFDNVPAGTYDLYIYSLAGKYYNSNSYDTAFTVGVTTKHAISPTSDPTTFVAGETYVVFNGVSPDGLGTIAGTWDRVIGTNALLDGFQLVSINPVPEPHAITLACFGAIGLLRVVRRRKVA